MASMVARCAPVGSSRARAGRWRRSAFRAIAPTAVSELLPPSSEESLPPSAPPTGWRRGLAALRHRNYRLWFAGQLFSLVGTWMQSAAHGYLAYELTHSSAFLGTVAFVAGIPTWIFMLWAGVIADRVSRRSVLLATQASMALGAATLAALVFTGTVRPWHLLALAFVLGTVNAFDAPARQAFVPELVDREDLGNAIALNALMFNAAVVVGPAVGGLVYAAIGPGWCFSANAVSFLGVIAALLAMRLEPAPPPSRRGSTLGELRHGLRYVAGHPSIRTIMLLVAATTLLGFAYVSLLPAFAVKVLGGDARLNGLLQSARGVGALSGAIYLAWLGRGRRPGPLLAVGSVVMPLGLIAFSATRTVPLALGSLVIVGVALIFIFNNANVLLQLLSEDRLRGRVMSVYSLVFFGLMPFGSLAMGATAQTIGEPLSVGIGAGLLLVCALAIQLAFPALRREKG